jgi:hypothetical protein
MNRFGKFGRLTAAHAFGQTVTIVAGDSHGSKATTTFVGKVIRIAREHGGRGATKVVLDDDRGGTYVIGLTLIREVGIEEAQ